MGSEKYDYDYNTGKGTACIRDQHMMVQNLDKVKSTVNKIIIY